MDPDSLAELIKCGPEFKEAEMARGSGAEFWERGDYAEKLLQKYVQESFESLLSTKTQVYSMTLHKFG